MDGGGSAWRLSGGLVVEAWSFGGSSLVVGDDLELAWGDFDLDFHVAALVGCERLKRRNGDAWLWNPGRRCLRRGGAGGGRNVWLVIFARTTAANVKDSVVGCRVSGRDVDGELRKIDLGER